MYIESDAWVTNLKQKLACGAALVSNRMEFYEFFTRALVPGVHYVEVDPRNLCADTAAKARLCHLYGSGTLRLSQPWRALHRGRSQEPVRCQSSPRKGHPLHSICCLHCT